MEELVLGDDLMTGISDIDDQHRELFDWANRLIFSDPAGVDAEVVHQGIWFLSGYVSYHFKSEEFAMGLFGYLRAGQHQRQHEYFKAVIADIRNRASEEGLTEALRYKLYRMMNQWFVNHIRTEDTSFARALKAHGEDAGQIRSLDDVRRVGTKGPSADDVELKPLYEGDIPPEELKTRLKS